VTRPRQIAPQLPPELEAIISRAMHLDPARRFPDMSALGLALLPFASERTRLLWGPAFAGHKPTAAPPRPAPSITLEPVRPAPTVEISGPVAVAALLAVALVGAGAVMWSSRQDGGVVARPPDTTSAAVARTATVARETRTVTASIAARATPTITATRAAPARPPVDPRCGPITVTAQEIALGERRVLALPGPRLGKVVVPLDRALGRRCATVDLQIARDVPYGVAFPTIATILPHTTEGVDVRAGADEPAVRVPAGLGVASVHLLTIELTDAGVRFRVLVGGELPKRGTPLAKLAAPLPGRSARGLEGRLAALAGALPHECVVYLGATAATPFGEVLDALRVAEAQFPGLRLSWIE
jgi:hypothetical protein